MRFLLAIVLAFIAITNTTYAEYTCSSDEIPPLMFGLAIPLISTTDNSVRFYTFENINSQVTAIEWNKIDLTREPAWCPYVKNSSLMIPPVMQQAWWILFSSNPRIELEEINGIFAAKIMWWKMDWNDYPPWVLYLDTWTTEVFKQVQFYEKYTVSASDPTNPVLDRTFVPLAPKRYGQILKKINWKIFLFGWSSNSWEEYFDIWRYYEKPENNFDWWQKKLDLRSQLPWFKLLDVYQLSTSSDINLLLTKWPNVFKLKLQLLGGNTLSYNWAAPIRINGVEISNSSNTAVKCNNTICKLAILEGLTLTIHDLKTWSSISKQMRTWISWVKIYLTNNQVIVKKWNTYYSWTQTNWDDFIRHDFFGYWNYSETEENSCDENYDDCKWLVMTTTASKLLWWQLQVNYYDKNCK